MLAEQLVLGFDDRRIAALTEAQEKNLIMRTARLAQVGYLSLPAALSGSYIESDAGYIICTS